MPALGLQPRALGLWFAAFKAGQRMPRPASVRS